MAPREVLSDAARLYGKRQSVRISAHAAGGVDVARRIEAAEAVDVVVLASDAIAKLVDAGKLLAEGRVDLMTSGIAIAVRTGAIHPCVADEDAVKEAVLAAASLSYSTGPSGIYLVRLFEKWGIGAAIRKRLVVPQPGVPVAQLIANGDVALGFQQMSELMNAPDVEVVGPMPQSIQLTTTFTAAITPACADRYVAGHFLAFLASTETEAIKQLHGMTPIA